jgi:hypothetical protein
MRVTNESRNSEKSKREKAWISKFQTLLGVGDQRWASIRLGFDLKEFLVRFFLAASLLPYPFIARPK